MQRLAVKAVNALSVGQVRESVDQSKAWLSKALALLVDRLPFRSTDTGYPFVLLTVASFFLTKSQLIDLSRPTIEDGS